MLHNICNITYVSMREKYIEFQKKWCYDTEGENSKFCTTGFPMGCYVTPQGVPKDACIISEKYRTASTFYLFNHVDITIYYHSGKGKILPKTL